MATIATGGSLTAASPLFEFQTQDAGIVGVEVSGTWTGTITFEARIGNAWANAQVFTVAGVGAAATTTANVSRLINAAGFSSVRANFSTPTSGTPTVIFAGSPETMGGSGGGGGAVTVADGADTAEGTTTDVGIITDISGTVIGFLRGAIRMWIAKLPSALISNRLDVNLGAAPATITAQGTAATGTPVTGNPVYAGASDGTNVQPLMLAAGNLRTVVTNTGGSVGAVVATAADTQTNAAGLTILGENQDFNGTNWDRHRGSQDVVLHASAATAAGTVNTDVTTYNYKYLVIHANVTNYNGGTVLFKVQMQDANAVFTDIPLATTGAVASGADMFLTVGPAAWGANATPVFYANQVLPRTIRIVQTVATATVTFSAAYCLKN